MPRLFGWGSFDSEPVSVYREKERKRTTELAQQGRRERLPEVRKSVGWNPVSRVREALDRPESQRLLETISRRKDEKDDGGGGFMGGVRNFGGKLKDVGSKTLDVLDAGAETTRDLLELTPTGNLTKAITPGQDRRAAGGLIENIRTSGGNPSRFLESQREDLNQRGFADRLFTQVVLDPSNIVGAGVATKALRGAAATRRGRISGSILTGLANANQAIDRTQARYAREVVGGIGGYTASALQGGDTQDNLTAAGLGVVAGRASRYLPGRFGTPNAARNFPLGAQITDETPNVERFTEALDRNGIEWAFDEGGVIRVADPERARQIADQEAARYFDDVENTLGQRGDPIATFEGDETYVVKGDPTGTRQDMYYYDSEGRRVSRMPTNSWASTVRNEAADHRGMDDVARIWEVLDEGTPDPRNEVLRQPWPEGAVIQRFKPQSDEWMAYVEEQYRGRTGGAGNPRAIELGRFDADRWVAERVGPDWSPSATIRAIATEIDYMETFITRTPKPSEAVRERAFTERLREIGDHIDRLGPDAILPPNAAGRTSSGVVRGEASGVGLAPEVPRDARPSDAGAEAVPLLDDAGEATPTPAPSVVRRRRAASTAGPASETGTPPPTTPPAPPTPPTIYPKREDLLRGRGRDEVIAESGRRLEDKTAGLRRLRMGRSPRAALPETEAVRAEKLRTDHIVNETVGAQVDAIRARAQRAGLEIVPDGERWVLGNTGVAIEDVVEGATEAARAVRATITPAQAEVLDAIQELNRRWNDTIAVHGGEISKVATETGEYWPRRVVERDGVARNAPQLGGGGRAVGAARTGRRTQESVEAGLAAQNVYAQPFDALKAGLRNKARMAQDQYLAGMISPLARPTKEAAPGFAERTLRGNHPLLSRVQYRGTTDTDAVLLGNRGMVFDNQVADELDDILTPAGPGRILEAAGAINSELTPLRASMDVSFILNQGMAFLQSSPRNAIKALRNSVDVVASAMGEPARYYDEVARETDRGNLVLRAAGIKQDSLEYLTQRGMHYVDEGATDEFLFTGRTQKLPGVGAVVKWSNETFGRYLNLARQAMANDALERGVSQGLRGADLDRHVEDAIKAVNRMSGWTGSEITAFEKAALFAPRFFSAQAEQVVAAFTKRSIEGQLARQHLGRLFTFGAIFTVATNEARGYSTDLDPRSNNFMRIRNVGGHDISPLGPFSTLVRGLAQGAAGSTASGGRVLDPQEGLERFLRSKASPALATAWSLMTESTYDARPVTKNPREKEFWTNTVPDIARESIPFAAQALVNEGIEPAIRDRDPGALVSGGIAAGLSAIGAQASEVSPAEDRDFRRTGSKGGLEIPGLGNIELSGRSRDGLAQEMFGKPYSELTGMEKSRVNEDEEVQRHQSEVERRNLEGTGDRKQRTEADTEFRGKMSANAEYLEAGRSPSGKVFTGNDYRRAYTDASKERQGAYSILEDIAGDKVLDGWYGLYDRAALPNGTTDYDELERLQGEYILRHPDVQDRVAEIEGTRDDPTMREYRQAKSLAAEYYAIPAYEGMTVEDSTRATEIITRANALTSNGRAANRAAALQRMVNSGEITEAERQLAVQAAKAGSNPARRAFRVDPTNKLFNKFYSDLTAAEAAEDAAFATTVSAGGSPKRKPAITSSSGTSRRRASRRR